LAGTNKERIIETALELFNVRGVQRVSTNHIAEHLSISPGNLYYHFANKEEIVRAIFPRIEHAVHAAIVLPDEPPISAAQLGAYYRAGLEGLWDHRFFYSELTALTRADSDLCDRYRELHRWLTATFVRLFELLARQGDMRASLTTAELERIAINAFIVWFAWVGYVHTARREHEVDRADMAEGALQSFLILAPYLDAGFCERVRAVIEA